MLHGGRPMSEQNPFDSNTAADVPVEKPSLAKKIHRDEAILLTLIVLSAVGIGITNFMPVRSFWFWVAMAPLFGIVSLYMGWSKARNRGDSASKIIWAQVLHWVGLFAAILLIYLLFDPAGRINNNQLALISLLALALTTFLAGVHFDWRFMVVGIILGLSVAGAAVVEQMIWMIAIPIVAAVILLIFWWKRAV